MFSSRVAAAAAAPTPKKTPWRSLPVASANARMLHDASPGSVSGMRRGCHIADCAGDHTGWLRYQARLAIVPVLPALLSCWRGSAVLLAGRCVASVLQAAVAAGLGIQPPQGALDTKLQEEIRNIAGLKSLGGNSLRDLKKISPSVAGYFSRTISKYRNGKCTQKELLACALIRLDHSAILLLCTTKSYKCRDASNSIRIC